jgi:hypothetical protein
VWGRLGNEALYHDWLTKTMTSRILFALSTALVLGTAYAANYSGGPHYFSWAELKVEPVTLTRPISESEAKKREENGEAYYIGHFDNSGKVLSVEKRFEKKVFFRVNYTLNP